MDDSQKLQYMLDAMGDVQRQAKRAMDLMWAGDRSREYWRGEYNAIAQLNRDWNRIKDL